MQIPLFITCFLPLRVHIQSCTSSTTCKTEAVKSIKLKGQRITRLQWPLDCIKVTTGYNICVKPVNRHMQVLQMQCLAVCMVC